MTTGSGKKRILWLEDEPGFIQHRVEILEDEGFEIDLIDTVSALEDRLKRNKYEIIILDVMMAPAKVFSRKESRSGLITGKLAFFEIIKKHAPRTPVVVFTALSDVTKLGREIREEMRKDDYVVDFIIKPSNITELLGGIEKALQKASQ